MRRRLMRLLGGLVLASALATPGIVIQARSAATCAPLGCQAWDIYDFQWWYFECYLPPCEANGHA